MNKLKIVWLILPILVCFLLIFFAINMKSKYPNTERDLSIVRKYMENQNVKDAVRDGGFLYSGNSRGNKSLSDSASASEYETPYGYEIYAEDGNDNMLLWYGPHVRGGAAFRAEWNKPKVFLGRVGLFWNHGYHYSHYGNVFCDFEFTKSADGTAGKTSFIGVYGWSRNPLINWYIVEDWYGSGVIDASGIGGRAEKIGEFVADDSVYFIYETYRENKDSINGKSAFTQFYSVRQTPRQSGKISITEHFMEWGKYDANFGNNMYEAKFLVQAESGTGWFDAAYLNFYIE